MLECKGPVSLICFPVHLSLDLGRCGRQARAEGTHMLWVHVALAVKGCCELEQFLHQCELNGFSNLPGALLQRSGYSGLI